MMMKKKQEICKKIDVFYSKTYYINNMSSHTDIIFFNNTNDSPREHNVQIHNDDNLLDQALNCPDGNEYTNCTNTTERSPSSAPYERTFGNRKVRISVSAFDTMACHFLSSEIRPLITEPESLDDLITNVGIIQNTYPPEIWSRYGNPMVSPILSVRVSNCN